MLQRRFRTFKIFAVLTIALIFLVRFLPTDQIACEIVFALAFVFGCLTAIQGISVVLEIVYMNDQQLTVNNKHLYEVIKVLDDIEGSNE